MVDLCLSIIVVCLTEEQKMKAIISITSLKKVRTSGYVVHGRWCNPHRSTTTLANLEIRHYDVIDDVITRKL